MPPTPEAVVLSVGPDRWGWMSFAHPGGLAERHLMPLSDLGYHAFDTSCPCGAFCDCPGSVIHFAYDGREAYEQGERRQH